MSEPSDVPESDYIRQLEQRFSERELEVKLLLEITEAINNQLDIEELLQAVAERARTLVNAETLLIPILDEACEEYTYRAGCGENADEIVGETLPLEFGICGWVWRNKRAWWRGILDELSDTDRNLWEKEAGSVLIAPLFGKKHFLGGISAINKIGDREFSRRDLELLTMFANSVTVTIENALFFDEMKVAQKQSQQYQQELEYLNREQESVIIDRTKELQQSNKRLQDTVDSLQQTQEKLIESEKMAALGNMVAGIAHEINTPLGVSVTSASYMEEEVKAIEKKFQNEQLQRSELVNFFADIHNGFSLLLGNLRRASDLIKNFKQVAADQSCDDCREINLHDYIDQVIQSLHSATRRKKISFNNSIDKQINLRTYPGVIYQIVSNLIFNSLYHGFPDDFSGDKLVTIASHTIDGKISLSYRDNGVGIKENNMKKILEPFFTTGRGTGSTGLGMSIVYNLVTGSLNGELRNHSKPEQGVHFEFDIDTRC